MVALEDPVNNYLETMNISTNMLSEKVSELEMLDPLHSAVFKQ